MSTPDGQRNVLTFGNGDTRPSLYNLAGAPILCRFCGAPAVAFFANRTDGRNGFVCRGHFNEWEIILCDPGKGDPWLPWNQGH